MSRANWVAFYQLGKKVQLVQHEQRTQTYILNRSSASLNGPAEKNRVFDFPDLNFNPIWGNLTSKSGNTHKRRFIKKLR